MNIRVIGCGGSGSDLVDALARWHFTLLALGHPGGLNVTLQDGDTVSPTNIGRQRFAQGDVGHNKALVLASRYNCAYGLEWNALPSFYEPGRDDSLGRDLDLLITCVDKAAVRVAIAQAFRRRGTLQSWESDPLWLDFGNGKNTGQAILGHLKWARPRRGELRLPNFLQLFPNAVDIDDTETPTCSAAEALRRQAFGINRLVVDAGMFCVLNPLMTQGRIENHGAFVSMVNARVTPLRIDPQAWDFIKKQNVRKRPRRRKTAFAAPSQAPQ